MLGALGNMVNQAELRYTLLDILHLLIIPITRLLSSRPYPLSTFIITTPFLEFFGASVFLRLYNVSGYLNIWGFEGGRHRGEFTRWGRIR